ncbi:MAG TPA: hypothetical protein PLW65_02355 [Pseudomonadota bacterium]|nr:hypothetical protein [Pseudomonadota bacterium]
MKNRAYCSRLAALGICFFATIGVFLGSASPAQAQLRQRFTTDDRGSFIMFGNTTGLDCRDTVTEKPIVGTVPQGATGLYNCRGLLPDTSRGDDVLWRSDEPMNGSALASALITPTAARSTAVLALPAGARVVYARLYWAGQQVPLLGAGKNVVVARPGVFSSAVTADAVAGSSTFLLNLLGELSLSQSHRWPARSDHGPTYLARCFGLLGRDWFGLRDWRGRRGNAQGLL